MTLPIAHIQCMISNLGLVVQRYPPRGMTINDENAKTMLISKKHNTEKRIADWHERPVF